MREIIFVKTKNGSYTVGKNYYEEYPETEIVRIELIRRNGSVDIFLKNGRIFRHYEIEYFELIQLPGK
jgi:hypothetical protein